jgi:hypothetical protein
MSNFPFTPIKQGNFCSKCDSYEFAIVNSNFILDNSWDVYVNDVRIGNYSGAPNTNVVLAIPASANIRSNYTNVLSFRLVGCVNDDYFEFEVRRILPNGNREALSLSNNNSGYRNSSFFNGSGTCDDTQFSETFQI